VQADAHLTKPFESRTLVETVRKLLGTSGRPAPPLASAPLAEPDPALIQTGFVDSDGILDTALDGAESSTEPAEPHILFEPAPVDSTISLDFEAAPADVVKVDTSPNEVASSQYGETLPLDPGQLPNAETPAFSGRRHEVRNRRSHPRCAVLGTTYGELVSPPGYREPSAPTDESRSSRATATPGALSFAVPTSVESDQPVEHPHVEAEPQA